MAWLQGSSTSQIFPISCLLISGSLNPPCTLKLVVLPEQKHRIIYLASYHFHYLFLYLLFCCCHELNTFISNLSEVSLAEQCLTCSILMNIFEIHMKGKYIHMELVWDPTNT